MRRLLGYALAATAMVILTAGAAHAQAFEGEIEVSTSYIDVKSFNLEISDRPVVKFTGLADFGSGMYAEAYAYSGFDKPFGDPGSEVGAEIGWEGEIGSGVNINVAAGRWANYQGAGLDTGDWFVRLGGSYENLSIEASVLSGESDTVILRGQYEAAVTERLTIRPSVAYLTAYGELNPGIEADYNLGHGFSARLTAVYAETDDGRDLSAAAGLVLGF